MNTKPAGITFELPAVSREAHLIAAAIAERNIEHEYVSLAQHLGLGITAWGPLAMGVLSGEYKRTPQGGKGNGLLVKVAGAPGTRTVH